jgi:hypothetical protein
VRSRSATSVVQHRVDESHPIVRGWKRRISFGESCDFETDLRALPQTKRPRLAASCRTDAALQRSGRPSFYVIKEADPGPRHDHNSGFNLNEGMTSGLVGALKTRDTPSEGTSTRYVQHKAYTMERTSSGHSIAVDEDLTFRTGDDSAMDDSTAAQRVESHLAEYRRRNRNSQLERILKTLVRPKSPGPEFEIDDVALQGIFCAANELFFYGSLKGRVAWDWSTGSNPQWQDKIIGTTAFRRAAASIGGYETLIVLSRPILQNKKYNRRLLISTFLHELIHCYLFITCGFQARKCGGHTDGFRRIAALIDDWVGPHTLHLCNMEADIEDFLAPRSQPSYFVLSSCNMDPSGDETTWHSAQRSSGHIHPNLSPWSTLR